jgi:uncharacterized membrane protein
MDAISEALARLVRRQSEVEQRLARIESALSLGPVAPVERRAAPEPLPPPPVAEQPVPAPPVIVPEPVPPPTFPDAPPTAAPAREPVLETQVGLTLINRIGVITLVLGIGFFFKWAVDNEWIGPAGRVLLGVVAGLAAIAVAHFLWRKGQQIFAQGVTAVGIAILYLAIYAAFSFYKLIPQGFAFAFMFVVTLLACALALRYDAIAIAGLGLIGGYITPILLSTGEDHPWFLFTYTLILNVGVLALVRTKDWKPLEILGVAATFILYWGWFADKYVDSKRLVATFFALVFYALFSEVTLWPLFAVSQISAAFAIGAIWKQQVGVFFFLELAIVLGGLFVADRKRSATILSVTFAAFPAVYTLWYADLTRPVPIGALFVGLTFAFLVFFVWNFWWFLVQRQAPRVPDMVVLALNGAGYFGACYSLLNTDYHAWLGLLAVAVAGVHLAFGMELWRRRVAEHTDPRPVLLSLGVALGFLTLAIPIQFSEYRITMAWSLEGAALTWIGARIQSQRMTLAALLVLALVAVRLGAIDSWMYGDPASYSAVWNSRFLTFLIAAVSCWLSALWAPQKELALIDYAAGHVFMLWGMTLEVIGWAERTTPQANQLSVETVAISILFALYAVVLVSAGVATKTAVNRIAGLGLMGFVVLKLYVFDVWQLGRIYRISAFVALGALLLATSFLYSHFRTVIESWWKNDEARS